MPATLPPLTTEEAPVEIKKRRKKKPPTAEADESVEAEGNREPTEGEGDAERVRKPRVKKRRPRPPAEPTQGEDSLNQTDQTDGNESTVVKKRKKKPKAAQTKPEFTGELPEEFEGLQEDFIDATTKPAESLETDRSNEQLVQTKAPPKRVFVETRSGFTSSGARKTLAFEATHEEDDIETFEGATVKAAVWTQKFFHGLGVFLYGLTGGMSIMQAVFVWVTIDHKPSEFVEIYETMALPFLCLFYFLITFCLVTALDKWDLEKPRRGYVRSIITCNNGFISSLAYAIALAISCVISTYEDKIQLNKDFPNLWYGNYTLQFVKSGNEDTYKKLLNETSTVHQFKNSDSLDLLRYLIVARTAFVVFAWLFISIQPQTDELVENLEEMEAGYNENNQQMTTLN